MISTKWITGRSFDLFWYIGACLTSYAMIYLHVGLGVSALLLWWFWILSVDGPHVFATLSRTYLDLQEWKERWELFWGSLLWFLLGPLSLFAGIETQTSLPYFVFLAFAGLWAYWHVVRQHYGFLVLYQKKNGEPAGKSNPMDYWIFYVLMLAPFVSFLLRHPIAREQVGLPTTITPVEQAIIQADHILIVAALALYVVKEYYNARQGRPWNLPKNLFLAACVPLHLLIFLHPYISTHLPIRLFVVFVTFYHNVQYHGIVWFYNRNRYQKSGEKFGPAKWINRNFLIYYAAALLFAISYRYVNWYFLGLRVPFSGGPNSISEMPLGLDFTISDLAFAFWWGFALHHYFLDQKIWKLSKDKKLTQELRLASA
ncbi:hypothetical protein L0156_13235 [bacterium]|nr:hypothetical protein [bacterium]